jgi:hypothetical protein
MEKKEKKEKKMKVKHSDETWTFYKAEEGAKKDSDNGYAHNHSDGAQYHQCFKMCRKILLKRKGKKMMMTMMLVIMCRRVCLSRVPRFKARERERRPMLLSLSLARKRRKANCCRLEYIYHAFRRLIRGAAVSNVRLRLRLRLRLWILGTLVNLAEHNQPTHVPALGAIFQLSSLRRLRL